MTIHTDYEPKQVNHIRFYFSEIERLRKALNNEQMGRLFYALADYAESGIKKDVEGDILFPYEQIVYRIEKAMNRAN